jgi:urease accessory protein
VSPFVGGLLQFFTPTHLLAVVALGLLAGQTRYRTMTLAVFAVALVAGSLTVASAIREVPANLVLLGLAAIAAGLVALGRALPPFVATLLTGAAGVSIPISAPPHEITIPAAIAAQSGTAAAALALFSLVMVIATTAERPWQRIGLRIAGSWIAASAILVLALRLAR